VDHGDVTEQATGRHRPRLFAKLARAVVSGRDEAPLAMRLCRSFVELLGADGGSITLANTEPEQTTLCVTDEVADRLEDLQEVLGEGPAPDAYTSGAVVVGNVHGEGGDRWPMFATAARSIAKDLTVYAFPMHSMTSVLGVITVHDLHGGRPERDLDQAAFFADAIGTAIVQQGHLDEDGSAWQARDRVNQATGMVVAQLGIGPDDALALIRAFAFSHGIPMSYLATEIIERRQNFLDNAEFRGDG
jgi:hypothetical protein